LCISFIPFPTDILGEYDDQQFAIMFYASSMAITSLVLYGLWWYVARDRRLVHESVQPHHIRYLSWRLLITPAVFLTSIGLSFVSPRAAQWCWALIIPLRYLLSRRYALGDP
jgi:TMEM175 potassium channel family protein